MEHTASAGIDLAHHAGVESTPSRRFGCGTGGHAARDDDHACGAALESDECTRGTRRGEWAAGEIDELNAEMVVARAEADRALAEERQRADRLSERVEALSAEVLRAEKQTEAVVGRAERAEAGRDAERARAEALRTSIDELKAGQAMMAEMHARELAIAQHDALAAQQAAVELQLAEEARKARGRWARLRAALQRE